MSDASAALGIIKRQGLGRTRHFHTSYLWIQHVTERGINFSKVPGSENCADLFTKPLTRECAEHLSELVGMEFLEGHDEICKGNVSCTSYSRTFTIHKWLRQTAYILTHNLNMLEHIANNGMNTTTHTDANIAQFWARRAPSVDAHVFIHRTCGSSLALCVIPYHPCMRTCVWLLEWSLFTRLSTSSSSSSSSST